MIKHLTKDSTLKTDTKRTVEEKECSKMETSKIKTKPILNNLRRKKKDIVMLKQEHVLI